MLSLVGNVRWFVLYFIASMHKIVNFSLDSWLANVLDPKDPKERQKILDSNHWKSRTRPCCWRPVSTLDFWLTTVTDPNPKQTSADLSLFLPVINWVLSAGGGLETTLSAQSQQIQSQNKRILLKFRSTKSKTGITIYRDYFWRYLQPQEHVSWRQKIFRQIAELSKSYSFGAKRNLETREIAAVQILIQF